MTTRRTGSRKDHPARDPAGGSSRLTLIVPGRPDQPTGGYRYDARVAAELRGLGMQVEVIGLDGRFPDSDEQARTALDSALSALPDHDIAVIDGLALGGLPDVAHLHAERLALVALVHHPLADETGIAPRLHRHFLHSESQALAACRRIVTTSGFTARRLGELGLVPSEDCDECLVDGGRNPDDDRIVKRIDHRIRIVPPGVDPAAPRDPRNSEFQQLLCVGSLVPRKGQDLLIDALAGLQEFAWRLQIVGDFNRDPEFAETLRASIDKNGLAERIEICGVQDTCALDVSYRNADLLVIPSHYEGYGMVVTEALARALPMIATTGGALADTVPPATALQVPPGDARALAHALRQWFGDLALRAEIQAGAEHARGELSDWTETGRRFAEALRLDVSDNNRADSADTNSKGSDMERAGLDQEAPAA